MPDVLCSFTAGKQLCCNLGCPVVPKIVHRCSFKVYFQSGNVEMLCADRAAIRNLRSQISFFGFPCWGKGLAEDFAYTTVI